MKYFVYMLRCADNSLYTGITTDPQKRLKEHAAGGSAGAKYTRCRGAVGFERIWSCPDRSAALKLEYRIKRLSKREKEALIDEPEKFNCIFAEKLDCNLYELVV